MSERRNGTTLEDVALGFGAVHWPQSSAKSTPQEAVADGVEVRADLAVGRPLARDVTSNGLDRRPVVSSTLAHGAAVERNNRPAVAHWRPEVPTFIHTST
ncbi:hypothetical protein [Halorientalis sp.]|uniref:hypothetical protein n=1 Tax=Halorientalis sp. TaxID=1931229 RepID=UPI0026104C6A|nr:hypothetical protein [Halorientalis sp.]